MPCPNKANGCEDLFERDETVRVHLFYYEFSTPATAAGEDDMTDSDESDDAVESVEVAEKKFVCEDCGKKYGTKGALKTHRKARTSDWTLKRCSEDGCTSKTIFKTEMNYKMHVSDSHGFNHRKCGQDNCPDPNKVYNAWLSQGPFTRQA